MQGDSQMQAQFQWCHCLWDLLGLKIDHWSKGTFQNGIAYSKKNVPPILWVFMAWLQYVKTHLKW